jgi:hypothetical protein
MAFGATSTSVVIAATSGGAATTGDATSARADFAYSSAIETSGGESSYQITLPLHVYQNTTSASFADLRVLNAAGEVVPYAVLRTAGVAPEVPLPPVTVPLFPLRGDATLGVQGLHFSIRSDGATVEVEGSNSAPREQQLLGYLLDTRTIDAPISALNLRWSPDIADFSTVMGVEVSEDLTYWRRASMATIASLHYNGAAFSQQRIDVGALRARYWRLSWNADQRPVELTAVEATPIAPAAAITRSSWIVDATAVADKPGEFLFSSSAHLPVDRINLQLPEQNSVANAEFYSRAKATDTWRRIATMDLYRLRNGAADTELINPASAITPNEDGFWRVVVKPAGAIRGSAASIEWQWAPHTVQFLARGAGPYELVYGNAVAKLADVPASTLMAGLQGAAVATASTAVATLAAPTELGGARRLLPPPAAPPPLPWKTWILWAVLAIGAVLIAAMAFRLLRGDGDGDGAPR